MTNRTVPLTLVCLALALTALAPAAQAHDFGCAASVHGEGVHIHAACDGNEEPLCFANTGFQAARVELLCGDIAATECVLVVHGPGVNRRVCLA